jgi:hypothetical protein
MTTMDVKEGIPRGMKGSESKGKQPENPPSGPSSPQGYKSIFSQGFGRSGGGGSGGPNPGIGTAPAVQQAPSKKRHIQKPENFTDPKDWDKFKQQEFLYYEEYRDDFNTDKSRIQFNLSFFTGGLSENFMANFIDQIINNTVPNWGSYQMFKEKCNATFQDTNKKTNAENQLMLLKRGGKTVLLSSSRLTFSTYLAKLGSITLSFSISDDVCCQNTDRPGSRSSTASSRRPS